MGFLEAIGKALGGAAAGLSYGMQGRPEQLQENLKAARDKRKQKRRDLARVEVIRQNDPDGYAKALSAEGGELQDPASFLTSYSDLVNIESRETADKDAAGQYTLELEEAVAKGWITATQRERLTIVGEEMSSTGQLNALRQITTPFRTQAANRSAQDAVASDVLSTHGLTVPGKGESFDVDRALQIVKDHSNGGEDVAEVLRRDMEGLDPRSQALAFVGFLQNSGSFSERVREEATAGFLERRAPALAGASQELYETAAQFAGLSSEEALALRGMSDADAANDPKVGEAFNKLNVAFKNLTRSRVKITRAYERRAGALKDVQEEWRKGDISDAQFDEQVKAIDAEWRAEIGELNEYDTYMMSAGAAESGIQELERNAVMVQQEVATLKQRRATKAKELDEMSDYDLGRLSTTRFDDLTSSFNQDERSAYIARRAESERLVGAYDFYNRLIASSGGRAALEELGLDLTQLTGPLTVEALEDPNTQAQLLKVWDSKEQAARVESVLAKAGGRPLPAGLTISGLAQASNPEQYITNALTAQEYTFQKALSDGILFGGKDFEGLMSNITEARNALSFADAYQLGPEATRSATEYLARIEKMLPEGMTLQELSNIAVSQEAQAGAREALEGNYTQPEEFRSARQSARQGRVTQNSVDLDVRISEGSAVADDVTTAQRVKEGFQSLTEPGSELGMLFQRDAPYAFRPKQGSEDEIFFGSGAYDLSKPQDQDKFIKEFFSDADESVAAKIAFAIDGVDLAANSVALERMRVAATTRLAEKQLELREKYAKAFTNPQAYQDDVAKYNAELRFEIVAAATEAYVSAVPRDAKSIKFFDQTFRDDDSLRVRQDAAVGSLREALDFYRDQFDVLHESTETAGFEVAGRDRTEKTVQVSSLIFGEG